MWRDEAHLLDMLLYARRAIDFNREGGKDAFLSDAQLQFATQYAIQVVGEAASKVSVEFRTSHSEIPWAQVINLRHRLVHDYPRIELAKIWVIVEQHLPTLVEQLVVLVPPEEFS